MFLEIDFVNKKIRKKLTDPKEMSKSFGAYARKIDQRLKELLASENLETMKKLPAARCHELTGDYKGKFAVDITKNYRLIFEADHNPIPQKDDGGYDWTSINKIRIIKIVDYH